MPGRSAGVPFAFVTHCAHTWQALDDRQASVPWELPAPGFNAAGPPGPTRLSHPRQPRWSCFPAGAGRRNPSRALRAYADAPPDDRGPYTWRASKSNLPQANGRRRVKGGGQLADKLLHPKAMQGWSMPPRRCRGRSVTASMTRRLRLVRPAPRAVPVPLPAFRSAPPSGTSSRVHRRGRRAALAGHWSGNSAGARDQAQPGGSRRAKFAIAVRSQSAKPGAIASYRTRKSG